MVDEIETADEFSEVMISAHAPATIGEARLSIAATDEPFRRVSIDTIIAYVKASSRYPNVRQVNIHFAPRRQVSDTQPYGQEGDYDLLIDGVREIAAYADTLGIEIVMENNNAYWGDLDDDVRSEDVDWSGRNGYFGMAPEEWIQICEDVDRPNVGLCLDSSHTCTYAHTFPEEQREERIMAFLAKPNLIRHVHWNDNFLYDMRGRTDSHAMVGKGTLPEELHRGIKYLDATLHLEHFYSVEGLEEELAYIDSL